MAAPGGGREDMAPRDEVLKVLRDFGEIDFLRVVSLIVGGWLLIKAFQWFLPWIADKLPGKFRFYILPLVPVLRLVIAIGVIIMVAPLILKPKPEHILAVVGAASLAIGFAFKDFVSSLAAGVVAIYERPYRPGDWVRVDDAYGEVKSVESRAIRIVTLDDTTVTIPHNKIWDTNIYNANDGKRELMCVADFYLHPRHNAALVRQKLHEVALTSPYLQIDRPITVIVLEKPWGTHYRVKAYPVEGRDQLLFTSDLTIRGKVVLEEIGVEFAVLAAAMEPFGRPRRAEGSQNAS